MSHFYLDLTTLPKGDPILRNWNRLISPSTRIRDLLNNLYITDPVPLRSSEVSASASYLVFTEGDCEREVISTIDEAALDREMLTESTRIKRDIICSWLLERLPIRSLKRVLTSFCAPTDEDAVPHREFVTDYLNLFGGHNTAGAGHRTAHPSLLPKATISTRRGRLKYGNLDRDGFFRVLTKRNLSPTTS